MTEADYVLGTHDAEIERLGLQHRVWRPRMLDAFRRAGITIGQHVADVGCGPGYATIDLAEIVGAGGRITAYDRSARFLAHLRQVCRTNQITHVDGIEADLDQAALPIETFDAIWCRWVLSFITAADNPLRQMCGALRPGGVAVFHEYLDYGSWRWMPSRPELERFVQQVIASWQAAGGRPDIGGDIPMMLERENFEVISTRPLIDVVTPNDYIWNWPVEFLRINIDRLQQLRAIDEADAREIVSAYESVAALPGVRMVTPCVLEVIARKR